MSGSHRPPGPGAGDRRPSPDRRPPDRRRRPVPAGGPAPAGRPVRDRQRRGREAEELAARHLAALGYRVVARNVRCPWGEADLICRDGDEWVVVEVRSRRRPPAGLPPFGTPEQSLDARKFRRLVAAGRWFLARAGAAGAPWRIDLVAVTWPAGPGRPEVSLYRRLEGGAQR
ncbi:MAG TPA: YraN family protein [Thermaerobacter sp.]